LVHADDDNFVVNLVSLFSPVAHQELSNLPPEPMACHNQLEALHKGIAWWCAAGTATGLQDVGKEVDPWMQAE
jgi:hypothetical protein